MEQCPWLNGSTVARAKCRVRLERLEELGRELRRPEADYLRDNIYELRAQHGGINYRMLYFFHGRTAVVVSHGLTKQQAEVPAREIERAKRCQRNFVADQRRHTFVPPQKE
jgi:phage-related protein